jgi:precorrin-4/cobalt-precorrin-4 C11-methyltransferase
VTGELVQGGYASETTVYVVERASWPDQRVIRGTLGNIAAMVRQAGITRQALIMVGEVFGDSYARSRLYDKGFSHGFRESTP